MPNEAASFRASREENFAAVFQAAGHFCETITFYPAGGGPAREIQARIRHEQRELNNAVSTQEEERILVTVGRDEEHANGGVAMPRVMDALRREGDLDTQRFAFSGEVRHSTDYSWTLVFTRPKPRILGTGHRR